MFKSGPDYYRNQAGDYVVYIAFELDQFMMEDEGYVEQSIVMLNEQIASKIREIRQKHIQSFIRSASDAD